MPHRKTSSGVEARSGESVTPAAAEKRAHIVRMAAALFDDRGYAATSMADIAAAVGVRKPTLYHYFKSKDEILYWIHEEFIDMLIDGHELREAAGLAPLDLITGVVADVIRLMETHKGHVRTFFEHHRELPDDWRESSLAKRDHYQRMVEHILEKGSEGGAFRRVDPKLTSFAIFGMVNWTYQWFRPGGAMSADAVAKEFVEILLHGIGTDSPTERSQAAS